MNREVDVIHAIWDVVRASESNQDDSINERLLRAFLRIHRGKHLNKVYQQGLELPDEVFQFLGPITFTYNTNYKEFISTAIPKLISFKHNSGLSVDYNGYPISVASADSYVNASYDKFNKNHPILKLLNNRLVLKNGLIQPAQLVPFTSSRLNATVTDISNSAVVDGTISLDTQTVLVDTDDEPGYDWTKSNYPMPDDLIEDLINSVNAREFNLFLRMKSDETGDMRNNANPQNVPEEH